MRTGPIASGRTVFGTPLRLLLLVTMLTGLPLWAWTIAASCQPRVSACPANVDVPAYLSLIAQGRYAEALDVHRDANPFPSVCGRVCPAFCEKRCRRGDIDEPIAIRQALPEAG